MANKSTQNSYDQVPYPSLSFTHTHPNRMATIAALLGMDPPAVDRCRVLELGCAGGGNLIPMAQGLPESEFVGLDFSAGQIAEAREAAAALGLKNISFHNINILDVEAEFGQFDYIIAHGVYSWVPPETQDKLLKICRQNLAPAGVAYVSYNTYPGWHLLGMVRDMMNYYTRRISDPAERATKARELLDFLTRARPAGDNPHASFLNSYLNFFKENLIPKNDAFLLHDELEQINEPVYFYQFVERAAGYGLQYLADAEFQNMLAGNLPPETSSTLRQMAKTTVEVEQYLDFLRNQSFRKSLLCHQEIQLTSKVTPQRLAKFQAASSALPAIPDPDIYSDSVEQFLAPDGTKLAIDHPVSKAAMLHLIESWPRAVPFRALLAEAQTRLNGALIQNAAASEPADDAQILSVNLLKAYSRSENLVELHLHLPHFVKEVSEYPVASPAARYQAQRDLIVTNMRHERVHLNPVCYRLLACLDGSHNRAALLAVLAELAAEGIFELKETGSSSGEPAQIEKNLPQILDSELHRLANAALLVG